MAWPLNSIAKLSLFVFAHLVHFIFVNTKIYVTKYWLNYFGPKDCQWNKFELEITLELSKVKIAFLLYFYIFIRFKIFIIFILKQV